MNEKRNIAFGHKYESVFCVFMAALAFLWRDNPNLIYPQILYLFMSLLGLNLAAGLTLRWWPAKPSISAAVILANCAVITGVLEYSGGPGSNLWVLYLLPIYTVCMFLGGREVAWVTGGVLAFNGLFHALNEPVWNDAAYFLVALKSALFLFAALTTFSLAKRERTNASRARAHREHLRRMEDEARGTERKLERARRLAEVGMVTSGVAHDLKNPLLVILASTELMLSHEELSEDLRQDIRRIRRSAELCRRLAVDVLGGAENKSFRPEPCRLHDIIDSALSLMDSQAARRSVQVRRVFADGSSLVSAQAYDLQRVFLNLISNAVDAMPRGGTLTLRTRRYTPRVRGIPVLEACVEDTGGGIPAGVMERMFEAFNTSKPPDKGTGLGLHLAKEIADRHGGTLTAGNMAEGGARFILTLPLLPEGERAGKRAAAAAAC